MPSLALIGGGGFAKEVADAATSSGFTVECYYADQSSDIGFRHRGDIPDLLSHRKEYDGIAFAIGAVNRRTIAVRRKIIGWLTEHGIACPAIVSPHAIVGKTAKLGDGTYVAHNAVVQMDAVIGRFGLINTAAQIGHDCVLGENVTVSSLGFVGGGTTIGRDSLIGAGALVLQGAKIGEDAMVGFGCKVLRKLEDHGTITPRL